jgi:SP family facilitated glucose transporter-like MFS transporter 8
LIALGLHFYLKDLYGDVGVNLDWLPLTSLIVYICAFGVGLGPTAWIILGEICGNDIKGFAVGLGMTVNWLFAFIVTKFYTNLVDFLKIGPTFWLFGILSFLSAIYVVIFIPETKSKSFSEIQAKLSK